MILDAITGTVTVDTAEEAERLRDKMASGDTLQLVTEEGFLIHLRLVRERMDRSHSFDWVGAFDESLNA